VTFSRVDFAALCSFSRSSAAEPTGVRSRRQRPRRLRGQCDWHDGCSFLSSESNNTKGDRQCFAENCSSRSARGSRSWRCPWARPMGAARANHVKIEGSPRQAVPPYPAPASSQTIHADHITAQQIRADTIYANKMDADNVTGQIHQSKDVKVGDTHGEIKAPE